MSYSGASSFNLCSGSTFSGEYQQSTLKTLFEQDRQSICSHLEGADRNCWIVYERKTLDQLWIVKPQTFATEADAKAHQATVKCESLVLQPFRG